MNFTLLGWFIIFVIAFLAVINPESVSEVSTHLWPCLLISSTLIPCYPSRTVLYTVVVPVLSIMTTVCLYTGHSMHMQSTLIGDLNCKLVKVINSVIIMILIFWSILIATSYEYCWSAPEEVGHLRWACDCTLNSVRFHKYNSMLYIPTSTASFPCQYRLGPRQRDT